jgi:hypothetical protein
MLIYTSDNLNISVNTEMFLRKKAELYGFELNEKNPQMSNGLVGGYESDEKSQCGILNLSANIQINGKLKYLFYSFSVRDNARSLTVTLPAEERISTAYSSINTIIETINQLGYSVDVIKIQSKINAVLDEFMGANQKILPIQG